MKNYRFRFKSFVLFISSLLLFFIVASLAFASEIKDQPAGDSIFSEDIEKDGSDLQKAEFLDLRAEPDEEKIRIRISASQSLEKVNLFTVENPPRIVLDIKDLNSSFKGEQKIQLENSIVRSVRHYAYPDKLRVVLDTDKDSLQNYKASSLSDGYEILVFKKEKSKPLLSSEKAADQKVLSSVNKPESKKLKLVNIAFIPLDEGRSRVFFETDGTAEYKISEKDEKKLLLRLKGVDLPKAYARPLITKSFESALDEAVPSLSKEGDTLVEMNLREAVRYKLRQDEGRIEIDFEASRVAPANLEKNFVIDDEPVFDKSFTLLSQKEDLADTGDDFSESQEPLSRSSAATSASKKFSGLPISIDFYDTDIKNVFRILQHISGRNFAVDKDVTGKVTMSLEHPVPWDQIMDLVLRMNGLGMVEDNNILRIATLETLRREESIRQDVLRARYENERRETELAPIFTEYILINYSNVSSEIMPHIQNLLTERGKASSDARNNQLILTDTAEVIAKAKRVIARIDKITPQVVIEARIVEASESFGRDMGVRYDASSGTSGHSPYATIQKDVLGGKYGYNVSLNTPTGAAGMGLHFARIAGTQLALNAQLNLSEQRGETKIVSSPRIVTLDNKKATINQGIEIPYTTRNKDGDVVTSFKNVDLKLEVTPHVTADNRVAMDVSIDKNDLHEMTEAGPSMRTKKVETELLVNDGDTIVIGGVVTSDFVQNNNRIPFLSSIPLIGWLFKSEVKKEQKTELLIFLTPRIVQLENPQI